MRCPKCKEPVTVPAPAQRLKRPVSIDGWILMHCPECDGLTKVQEQHAGAEVTCGRCDTAFAAPAQL